MLVLARKKGESIIIPNLGIEIVVIKVGTRCKLGIKAPKDTKIVRNEVLERDKINEKIYLENKNAEAA